MKLFLKDGTEITGEGFGADTPAFGEVVFNTSMVGYIESFTDPSYAGQILVCTYPLIGNYGVPPKEQWESNKVQIAGLIVSEYCEEYSHWEAKQSLSAWLKHFDVPAIQGVDTRALTKKLREHGVMLGALGEKKPRIFSDPNEENLVAKVSCKKKEEYGNGPSPRRSGLRPREGGPIRIIAVDCGMKENIIRKLVRTETTVIRVPWDYDFTDEKYDALFLSNGPGDPVRCVETIAHIKSAMEAGKPILGICLGSQLLALAAGASTYKLKYGHRGQNQTCIETKTKRCYITSQNHGFAVDAKSLPSDWKEWFVNANDGSNEGIFHKTQPWRSVQFHPEACPGPTDTAWIFDEFIAELKKRV